jgi:hypothetical protein
MHVRGAMVLTRCRSQDAPDYRPGFYACIACCLFVIVLAGLLSVKFLRDNRKAERGELIIECGEVSCPCL